MGNQLLEAIAQIANRERRLAIREGDYGWAVLCAIAESWAIGTARAQLPSGS